MRARTLLDLCFIIYCVEAGVLLCLAPWNPTWDRALFQLPFPRLWLWGLYPSVRAAITAFGLVHLIWGAHELDRLLQRWRPARRMARGD